MPKIYLLDLNYTLAAKCKMPFRRNGQWVGEYDPSQDQYCPVLVAYLKAREALGEQVILITARPDTFRHATLTKIKEKPTEWEIQESYWKPDNYPGGVPKFKRDIAQTIAQRDGIPFSDMFGIESNKTTRARYAELEIVSHPRWQFLQKMDFDAPCRSGCTPDCLAECQKKLAENSDFTKNSPWD